MREIEGKKEKAQQPHRRRLDSKVEMGYIFLQSEHKMRLCIFMFLTNMCSLLMLPFDCLNNGKHAMLGEHCDI